MSKQPSYSEICEAQQLAIRLINEVCNIQHLPKELQQHIESTHKIFKNYEIEKLQEPINKITGHTLNIDEISHFLIQASGYTKWSIEENKNNTLNEHLKLFRDSLKLNIQPSDIKKITASRNINDKQEICYIVFNCIPGYLFIEFQTRNVGFNSEKIIPNEELESFLYNEL